MKKLKLKLDETKIFYPDDVDRIVSVCESKGYNIEPQLAQDVWQKHSDSMCAGWLGLDKEDDELFDNIMSYCEEDNGE